MQDERMPPCSISPERLLTPEATIAFEHVVGSVVSMVYLKRKILEGLQRLIERAEETSDSTAAGIIGKTRADIEEFFILLGMGGDDSGDSQP